MVIQLKRSHYFGILIIVSILAGLCISTTKVSAATFTVSAGTDATEDNAICQLSEAITNINDQDTTYDDCTPTGSYGTDDVINVPTGTITLTDNLPEIEQSISVQGQGMGETVIDGGGGHQVFWSENEDLDPGAEFSFHGMTITGFALAAIFSQGSANVNISEVEVSGDNSISDTGSYGLYIMNNTSSENDVNAFDVYIHNINVDYDSVHAFVVGGHGGGITHADINQVTISDIHNTGRLNTMIISNGAYGGFAPHTTDAIVQNVTLSDISSNSAIFTFGGNAMTSTGSTSVDIVVDNMTISDVYGSQSMYGSTVGLGVSALAIDPSATADAHVAATNVVVSSVFADVVPAGCRVIDINPLFGGSGTTNLSLTSGGGNLSDDASCNDYFTDETDQTEVNPADLHLGTLANYGGNVPTIPLEAGSIAIDSGVTVDGLSTDARGVSRPQCSAYDSGAYEYNGDCSESPPQDTIALTTPTPNNTTSYLLLPDGVTNASFSTTDPHTIPQDIGYSYPAGLVSFQFNTDPGSTETITLYFDLPGNPSDYVARKYDTTNHSFSTIPGATITRETYLNQSLIKLTYDITDGDTLDQDHTVNGTIIDPVGLGTQTTTSPDTGMGRYWLLAIK